MLEDVTRRRLALPERGVEFALLDWGGDGPLALLHHANGFCAATWDLVARPLRERYRVVGMDARGHGDSSKPEGPEAYAWPEFGADLAAVARVLAAEHGGSVALGLGHSFGGTSMVMAAAAEPGLFGRLLLVDPVLPPPPELARVDPQRGLRADKLVEGARKRRTLWPDRAEARASWREKPLFADWDPRALELYLDHGMADRPDGQVELKCSGETEATIFSQGFEFDVWKLAEAVGVPVLLLWATRGDFPRAVYEQFAARLGDGRVEDVESGHLVPMERPELVLDAVRRFAPADGRAGAQRSTGSTPSTPSTG